MIVAPEMQKPDLYGQSHPIETPELLRSKLTEFDARLQLLPEESTFYVRQAQRKCPELLTDGFKLLFLRCEVFQVDLAIQRYCKYWKKRYDTFGPDKAYRPLHLDGNLKDCLDTARMGVVNVIDCRESCSGRSILYIYPNNYDKQRYTVESFIRIFWYFIHTVLENEETAKKGLIVVDFQDNVSLMKADRKIVMACNDCFRSALPVRLTAYHICHPAPFMSMAWPVVKALTGDRLFKRIHVHSGSKEKVLEDLSKFELKKCDIPIELGGEKEIDIERWINQKVKNENVSSNVVDTPIRLSFSDDE